jgi:serine/threonine-protein kinase
MDAPLILDRYRLVERLAVGGSAEVWRAHDEQLDRPVAVKRLHAHLLPDEASRRRLAAEARASAQLSHPVIVDVYDVDTEGESPAIVMELVEGESLAARIAREGPLDARRAAAIAADVADALYHAHQRGLVHRDVKPGNVLLSADGRTRLVDFGIARSLAESAERLTQTGTVMGTLAAMAPEQLAAGPIGPRTDLYGLGVVLHEAVTGRPPYAGVTSPVALADAQRAGPPPLDGVEPSIGALIAACLAFRPEDRPVHAGALSAALRAWLAGDSSRVAPIAPTAAHAAVDTSALTLARSVVAPAPAPAASAPTVGREARTGSRTYRGWPLLAGLLAAALVAGVVLAVINLGAAPPTGGDATQSATPSSAVATPTAEVPATPAPELAGWARNLADSYQEECGVALDPTLIAGMRKDDAEALVEPMIDECENEGGD